MNWLRKKKIIKELEKLVDEQMNRISYLEKKSCEDEMLRRQLHNAIQELKGNIRVICRVRPFLNAEKAEYADQPTPIIFPNTGSTQTLEIITPHISVITGKEDGQNKSWQFSFDKVFQPNSCQGEVF